MNHILPEDQKNGGPKTTISKKLSKLFNLPVPQDQAEHQVPLKKAWIAWTLLMLS